MVSATELSHELSGLVERLADSVVRVSGKRRFSPSGIFWTQDIVVTANHSVERDDEVEVHPAGAGPIAARVIGRDPATDLAALRLSSPRGEASAPWQTEAGVPAAGHIVLGLARPGRSARASLGIVSRVADAWRTPLGGRMDSFLETDLAMHPGFSGSALVDLQGRIVGLNTSGILRGVSLAVPAATVRRIVESLRARGAVKKGYLGIGTYGVRLPAALEAAACQSYGLIVLSVQPDSPAERGGVILGDVLVSLGGARVQSVADLVPLLDEERVGEEMPLEVLRGGDLRSLQIAVGDRASL
ncbi:MAG: S1C family serine protease [Thermoanaerobaculia bacterium]